MATLLAHVDRATGNFQDIFIYTMNASFNGIDGNIDSAQIKFFLPDMLNVYLGDVGTLVENIEEEVVSGGKNIIFNFGTIVDMGIAVRLGLGVAFKNGTNNHEEYIFEPKMIINGMQILETITEPITLVIQTRFELSREMILPKVNPAPAGTVYYKVTLENFGDLGGKIENIVIYCGSTIGLTIDASFIVEGLDHSQASFQDKSQDGIVGTVSLNELEFIIPIYFGEKYEFIYKASISADVLTGTELNTIAQWSIDGIDQSDDIHRLLLGEPEYSATISLYGPDYTFTNEYICYEINIENDGNQVLQTMDLLEELPPDIDYYEFETGVFHIGEIEQEIFAEYFIEYETINGLIGTIGPYHTNSNTSVDLEGFIPVDDNLSKLKWRLPVLGVGVSNKKSPHIKGKTRLDSIMGSSILNHLTLTWSEPDDTAIRIFNHSTIVDNNCVLNPKFSLSPKNTPVKPNQIIRYKIGANCRRSRLNNPILVMILPDTLEYVGNVTAHYTDHFENSVSPNTPPAVIQENFINQGSTLVKFSFVDEYAYNFKQKSNIRIEFDTRVKVGAKGTVSASMQLNTSGSTGVIAPWANVYRDDYNIAQDETVSKNYAQSSLMQNDILFFVSTSSDKKVKGLLDSDFMEEPFVGKTIEGGELDYKISVKNIGNADLEQIEIVDILPYIGDSGVIETSSSRNSQYEVYPTSELTAKILGAGGDAVSGAQFDIFYSTSKNPLRFGSEFNMIGEDDNWNNKAPQQFTSIKSFKIVTKNTKLLPNQTLEIMMKAMVPVGATSSIVAWNSFAADVIYKDIEGTEQHLLAIEPEKVGIEVVQSTLNTGKIGGFVWFDTDKNGIASIDEPMVNDVGVVLYDEIGTPLRATFTTTDMNGNDGYYVFGNLDLGIYYVKFFIEDDKYQFTKNVPSEDNGSKVNSNSGVTSAIQLNVQQFSNMIHAGIIDKQGITIDELLKVNKSSRSMVRNVIYNQMLISMKYEDVIELTKI